VRKERVRLKPKTAKPKTTKSITSEAERKGIKQLRDIAWNLGSPSLEKMYEAASHLATQPVARSLLPEAVSLSKADDSVIRKSALRVAGQNAYGPYVKELMSQLKEVNPAEREQVLQGIEEKFILTGGPKSSTEQKRWAEALQSLGREHQPTIVGIMALLGTIGTQWVKGLVSERVEAISFGSVQRLTAFPEATRVNLLRTLCQKSAEKRLDLLPYIRPIIDPKTVQFLHPFLRNGNWQVRSQVAETVAKQGVTAPAGIVMDVVADGDWRVKQALLDNMNIEGSRFLPLLKIVEYLVRDPHARVHGLVGRTLLRLGSEACRDSNLTAQRDKTEKQFRAQLLEAAPANRDIDSSWLGVSLVESFPIPVISEEEESGGSAEAPQGVSLEDIGAPKVTREAKQESSLDLMAALVGARDAAKARHSVPAEDTTESEIEPVTVGTESTPSDTFMRLLRSMTAVSGKEVEISKLKNNAASSGLDDRDFNLVLEQLERDGIVYRSGKDRLSVADMEP
jgi:HEAT repeat protein